MNNIVLDNVNQEKDLEVVIDSDLKVSSQCTDGRKIAGGRTWWDIW